MALLRLFITFVLIYLAFRVITMYLVPMLVRWYIRRFQRKFYEQNPHLRQEKETRHGKTRVIIPDDQQKQDKKPSDDIGEYVDYEEIKEDKKKKDKE
jgi:predicted Holliday junction resolvase-like endonuclease